MISAKRLIKLARKWQKLAAIRRKRITLQRTVEDVDVTGCSKSLVVEKGHLVVYSADQRRFVLPLEYLQNEIVREVFKLAEEEFGLSSDGPLTLPCDAAFTEYIIALIRHHVTQDVEKALLMSLTSSSCSSSSSYLQQQATNQQLLICSF